MLNYVWLGFFLISALSVFIQTVFLGHPEVINHVVQATFDMSKTSFEIALGLTGTICLWLGLLKIAEKAGVVASLARGLTPLFKRLMPEVPAGHPALGSITMNMAANMLGLDNAATPVGIQAMRELQTLNQNPDTATNAQIMFAVINSSSVTILPISILAYRVQQGSSDPAAVFLPILLATTASTVAGIVTTAWVQRLKLWDKVMMAYATGIVGLVAGIVAYFIQLPAAAATGHSALLANGVLFTTIIAFLTIGFVKRVPIYEAFIEGAKEGFQTVIVIIPYLVAMLVAIGVMRASGAMEGLLEAIKWLLHLCNINADFVPALPTALMKPFSGSGARGMMIETMTTYGVDSFQATTAAVIQGSTETTFYVMAVYFGAVGIRRVRHAIACGLIADIAGFIAAITLSYWFFA
jgi:spore maturation protein SpmA